MSRNVAKIANNDEFWEISGKPEPNVGYLTGLRRNVNLEVNRGTLKSFIGPISELRLREVQPSILKT